MYGYEITARSRREDCCKVAVIIAVSGCGEEQAGSRTGKASFDHHLVNPINLDTLLKILAQPTPGYDANPVTARQKIVIVNK